ETGQPIWAAISRIGRAVLRGLQGDEAAAEEWSVEAKYDLSARRLSRLLAKSEFARGVIATTAGRQSDAVDHLSRMFLSDGPAFHELVAHAAAPLVIDCAIRAGRLDDARRLMDELEAMAGGTTAPLVLVGVRLGRGLLANESEPEVLYEKALDSDPKWPFHYA